MPCQCGSDKGIPYSDPTGKVLLDLCPRCAAKNPTYKSIVPQTPDCRQCNFLGKCCRTTNIKGERS